MQHWFRTACYPVDSSFWCGKEVSGTSNSYINYFRLKVLKELPVENRHF